MDILFSFFLIFSGAAAFASIALFTRQPLIIAYIILGALLGPYGFGWIHDAKLIAETSHIGIIFLLYLIGLDLNPKSFIKALNRSFVVVSVASLVILGASYVLAKSANFSHIESLIIGAAMCFSSTIIGIKLLPTTVLHHKPVGELVVSLLLMQDLLAVLLMVAISSGASEGKVDTAQMIGLCLSLPLLGLFSFVFVKYVLLPLLQLFDRFHEYIFLLTLGWCLGLAQLANLLGLSHEIGAFLAGISLAQSPIAQYITEHLKPLRDFFLVLFFFALGAGFNTEILGEIWLLALSLALLILVIKPLAYGLMLRLFKETRFIGTEAAMRLGQSSEFSLLVAYLAMNNHVISEKASLLIQGTTIITFILSSYYVIFNYPSPVAISDKLRRD